jgi:transcriptional regulator with XRE-family HTH domain
MARPTGEPEGILRLLLAERLQQIKERYASVEEFVERAGIDSKNLYVLLKGQGNPKLETIERLAHRFGMSVFDFLGMSPQFPQCMRDHYSIDYDELVRVARSRSKKRTRGEPEGILSLLVAARLEQIKKRYENYEEFLERSSVSRGSLHYYMANVGRNLQLETLEKMAHGFGMTVFEFLGMSPKFAENMRDRHLIDYRKLVELARSNTRADYQREAYVG